MKRFGFLVGLAALVLSNTANAQNCQIPVSVHVDAKYANIDESATNILRSQLTRATVATGMSENIAFAQYFVTVKFDEIDKEIVSSAPMKIVKNLGANFYLVDVYTQKIYANEYIEIKGIGNSETKCNIDAVKRLNAQNARVKKFLTDARQKVLDYYNAEYPRIIKEAQLKATTKQYEEALAMISAVPSCCNGYDKAIAVGLDIYNKYRDTYALALLNQAKAAWASNPTASGAQAVVSILAGIDPESASYKEAMKLLEDIKKQTRSDIDFEIKKKYEDSIELEKMRIQAIKEIGVAYGKGQPQKEIQILGVPGTLPIRTSGSAAGARTAVNGGQVAAAVPSDPGVRMVSQNLDGAPVASVKLDGPTIFKQYGNAVFTILASGPKGSWQGSGFFINSNGLAVSNFHNFDGADVKNMAIKLPNNDKIYRVNKIVKSGNAANGGPNDYVVFMVDIDNTNCIPIAAQKPEIGERVYAIGSPRGYENTFSSGEISQWRESNYMQTTAFIDHGSSGGALLNEYGEVVGITSAGRDDSTANINFAISIDVIK